MGETPYNVKKFSIFSLIHLKFMSLFFLVFLSLLFFLVFCVIFVGFFLRHPQTWF